MFNFISFIHKPKFDAARQTGLTTDYMHEEQMHNLCEYNEKNDIAWSAGMNL